jgi:glycosyltransferase involved in cell wall biosynthesis
MKTFIKKTKKYFFKKLFLKKQNEKYIKLSAREVLSQHILTDFLLIVVAFNDEELIKLQYESLLKNLDDRFDYIVCDNSSDEKKSQEIRSFCRRKEIYYIRLPKNPGLDGSLSHGLALNWIFYNFILKIKPKYFGFLDHDIFAIFRGSFLLNLYGKNYFGIKIEGKKWYIWPGFAFFNSKFYLNKKMNFLPQRPLDTGSASSSIYMKEPEKQFVNKNIKTLESGNRIDFFCNVFHLVGGGNIEFCGIERVKEKREILYEILKNN